MNCQETQDLLSTYHDGELDSDRRIQLEVHLERCPECLAELAEIRRLSSTILSLPVPKPSKNLWQSIKTSLNDEYLSQSEAAGGNDTATLEREGTSSTRSRHWLGFAVLSTAALMLIGFLIKWSIPTSHNHAHYHQPLKAFIEQFATDPLRAQMQLTDHYSGRSVSADEATQLVGYRPANMQSPPQEFTRDKMYVLDMPCCRCVEVIWNRSNGTSVAIFEHNEPVDDWFAGRSSVDVDCAGKNCRLVTIGRQFAASWRVGKRMLTVVGLRDTEELAVLVATFT